MVALLSEFWDGLCGDSVVFDQDTASILRAIRQGRSVEIGQLGLSEIRP